MIIVTIFIDYYGINLSAPADFKPGKKKEITALSDLSVCRPTMLFST